MSVHAALNSNIKHCSKTTSRGKHFKHSLPYRISISSLRSWSMSTCYWETVWNSDDTLHWVMKATLRRIWRNSSFFFIYLFTFYSSQPMPWSINTMSKYTTECKLDKLHQTGTDNFLCYFVKHDSVSGHLPINCFIQSLHLINFNWVAGRFLKADTSQGAHSVFSRGFVFPLLREGLGMFKKGWQSCTNYWIIFNETNFPHNCGSSLLYKAILAIILVWLLY